MSTPAQNAAALFRAGVEHHRAERLNEAERLYRQALSIEPRDADALHLLGLIANHRGDFAGGARLIGQAIAITPGFAPFHLNRGLALMSMGRMDEAAAAFAEAARLDPNGPDPHALLGSVMNAMGRHDQAASALATAVRLRPDFAEAYCDLGIALCQLGRLDEALRALQTSLRLAPDNFQALTNLGIALKDLGRAEEAIAVLDRAIALNPRVAEIHTNRGNAHADLGRLDEAMADFDRAVAVDPNFVLAHIHRAFAMLLKGDFAGGLARYEWRKRLIGPSHPRLAGPQWPGRQGLAGLGLFIHCEQGLGDTINFARYASLAADRGAEVTLSVQPSLLPLLEGFDPRVRLIPDGEVPAAFDHHISLLSLPLAFGTTLESIPPMPAYLRPRPEKAATWAARLGAKARPRVGLVWSGNALHKNDRNRSIPLEMLEPLLSAEVEWIGLQTEIREHDRAALAVRPGLGAHGAALNDFSDTAALIENLDLVVTVDTSVAHLSAAMGKPTWILLPFAPDWRWLLDREDSPWHPTARLFRQPAPGAWPEVIARARRELGRHFATA